MERNGKSNISSKADVRSIKSAVDVAMAKVTEEIKNLTCWLKESSMRRGQPVISEIAQPTKFIGYCVVMKRQGLQPSRIAAGNMQVKR